MSIENDDLLYVYDVSEGVGKKIKYSTLKSGSGTGELGYWNRTGTTLSPVNGSDSVEVAGIVTAGDGTGNYGLFANSNADYGSGSTIQATNTNANGYVWVGSNGSITSTIRSDGKISVIGTGTDAAPNISLNADGSANYLGALGVYRTAAAQSTYAGYLNGVNTSIIYADGKARFDDTVGIGNISAAPNISLNADGTSLFNGIGTWGGNPDGGLAAGARINPVGVVQACNATGINAVFTGYVRGTSVNTSRINADGSATFAAGNVDIYSDSSVRLQFPTLSADSSAFAIKQGTSNNGTDYNFVIRQDGDVAIGGQPVIDAAGYAPNISLNADGSASFAGKVTSASTEASDPDTTLATKDYVDANSGGGGGELPQIIPDGNEVFPVGAICLLGGMGDREEPITPGDVLNAGNGSVQLRHTNVENFQSNLHEINYGTWRCLGLTIPGGNGNMFAATLFQRVS